MSNMIADTIDAMLHLYHQLLCQGTNFHVFAQKLKIKNLKPNLISGCG